MTKEIILDVSLLQPPLPMEMAMDATDKLKSGEYIKMVHRMQPHPLYNILLDNGFRYKIKQSNDLFEIFIWIATDKSTGELIKGLIKKE